MKKMNFKYTIVNNDIIIFSESVKDEIYKDLYFNSSGICKTNIKNIYKFI